MSVLDRRTLLRGSAAAGALASLAGAELAPALAGEPDPVPALWADLQAKADAAEAAWAAWEAAEQEAKDAGLYPYPVAVKLPLSDLAFQSEEEILEYRAHTVAISEQRPGWVGLPQRECDELVARLRDLKARQCELRERYRLDNLQRAGWQADDLADTAASLLVTAPATTLAGIVCKVRFIAWSTGRDRGAEEIDTVVQGILSEIDAGSPASYRPPPSSERSAGPC